MKKKLKSAKELLKMSKDKRLAYMAKNFKCHGEYCDPKECPFKELYAYREDGYCVVDDMPSCVDNWIAEDVYDIECLKRKERNLEERIKRYKTYKQLLLK